MAVHAASTLIHRAISPRRVPPPPFGSAVELKGPSWDVSSYPTSPFHQGLIFLLLSRDDYFLDVELQIESAKYLDWSRHVVGNTYFLKTEVAYWRLRVWLSSRVFLCASRGPGFDFWHWKGKKGERKRCLQMRLSVIMRLVDEEMNSPGCLSRCSNMLERHLCMGCVGVLRKRVRAGTSMNKKWTFQSKLTDFHCCYCDMTVCSWTSA